MDYCYFCHGNIIEDRCIHCGRSTNIQYELRIMAEQKKPHRNLHTCTEETEKASRSGKRNPYGYGRREE